MEIIHLGRDIWMLHEFPSGGFNSFYSDWKYVGTAEQFIKRLKTKYQRKDVIGFTVKGQETAGKQLKKAGFKRVLRFYSSHGSAIRNKEVITMWRRLDEKAPKRDHTRIRNLGWNCSIRTRTGEDNYYRCVVRVPKVKEAPPKGFRRLGKTNLFIKINGSKVW